jgi:hypothetical protein
MIMHAYCCDGLVMSAMSVDDWICLHPLIWGGDQILETCQSVVIRGTASATCHVIRHHHTTAMHTTAAAVGQGLQDAQRGRG